MNDEIEDIPNPERELCEEWFTVENSDCLSVVFTSSFDSVEELRTAQSGLGLSARWIEELGRVSANRVHLGLIAVSDIDDERRVKFVPLHKFEVVVGPMRVLFLSPEGSR